jgi:capsular exopolysaccharide synthesis family protein
MLPNPEIRGTNIYDYLKIIQKRLNVIIAALIIIPVSAAIYVFTVKPIFRATTSILIEKQAPKITKFEEVYTPGYSDLQFYQTQYKILSSRAIAERVFDELKLKKDPEYRDLKDPAEKLRGKIKIDPIKNSQIVLVHVDDTDAMRASAIANALAKEYIQQDIETRNRAAKEAVGFLESQLTDIKKKLRESEEAFSAYIQKNRIVTVPDIEKKTESLLDSLRQNKATLEKDLAEAAKRYKNKHPKMISLNAQLEQTNKRLEEETNTLLSLNEKMTQYNILKKEVESNQQLYNSMLTRAKETSVSEKVEASNIRVVDSAKPPEAPFKPKKAQTIAIAIFLAAFIGIGLAFFLEYLDASIRTADDVSVYLQLPFLGYIPSVLKEAKTDQERALICSVNPKSSITESYRAIRTAILFASPEDKPLKKILVTAALPEEGKSFVSVNLSTVFSQVNEKIVLLDVDMRKPKIHKNLNVTQQPGLSNFLTGNADSSVIIKSTAIQNLFFIPSGNIPPNPSELLTSGKLSKLIDELLVRFDRVIIDSPPILSAADTSLLSNIVDGVVLVVKGASTRLEAVTKAKQKVLEAKGRIIGVIVNNIEPEKEDRYYYYHYYSEEGKK